MKQKSKKILSWIIILLILIEIAVCGLVYYEGLQNAGQDSCIVGNSCSAVQNTIYGEMFGIKLSLFGLGAFIILLAGFFINKKLFFWLSLIGACFAIYLLSVQIFVLKQICSNCFFIDICMLFIFALTVIKNSRKK